MTHTLAIGGVRALSLGCAQAPSSPPTPTAADAKAFLDDANATTLKHRRRLADPIDARR